MASRIHSKLITAPTVEPVKVAEAKSYAWEATDTKAIENAIKAARELAEAYTGRAFMEQTWSAAVYDVEADEAIELPHARLIAVTGVVDKNGDAINAADYELDADCEPGIIEFATAYDKVVITYTAGTWADVDSVPQFVKQAIEKAAYLIHDNRASGGLPEVSKSDLHSLKIYNLG